MTRIRYTEKDPRAGRVVEMDKDAAQRQIEAGNAEEVGPDVFTSEAKDIATGDGSRGRTLRPQTGPNASPSETTTEGLEDDEDAAARAELGFDPDAADLTEEQKAQVEARRSNKATGARSNKAQQRRRS